MLGACTQCGKCVEACPTVQPAGIAGAAPKDVIAGVLDMVRTGDGPEVARTWAASCIQSGECIKACDYGVNPRFLLTMARVAMAQTANALPERRRNGVKVYAAPARTSACSSRLQLETAMLQRLGQGSASVAKPAEPPDFVFYTGCNVLKTPHIALLALDMMDTLGVSYQVMGGPSHCCGILQLRAGDVEMSGRMGSASIDKLSRSKWGRCCPGARAATCSSPRRRCRPWSSSVAARAFEMTPFLSVLAQPPRRSEAAPCASRSSCAWRCISIRVLQASWKRPPSCCRRCPA